MEELAKGELVAGFDGSMSADTRDREKTRHQ
jgi:hypothetical protein